MAADVNEFAKRYADAWCSQVPSNVSQFFAEKGSLSVNSSAPAVGRRAIADVAQGFMTAFPDMRVFLDKLSKEGDRIVFHWTLTGTNNGPGGTGNYVRISGKEIWSFGADGLIAESKGSFDADDYAQQINHGQG
jgi:hypothetical protein